MKIDYTNKQQFDDIYLHDAVFEGFSYVYEKREIRFDCTHDWLKKRNAFRFSNVIFFEMQGCRFWGPCANIYHGWVEENAEPFQRLLEMQREDEEKAPKDGDRSYSLLADGTEYFAVCIQMLSGDKLLIICESIDWEESAISEDAGGEQ